MKMHRALQSTYEDAVPEESVTNPSAAIGSSLQLGDEQADLKASLMNQGGYARAYADVLIKLSHRTIGEPQPCNNRGVT